jgi:hypothetical protein
MVRSSGTNRVGQRIATGSPTGNLPRAVSRPNVGNATQGNLFRPVANFFTSSVPGWSREVHPQPGRAPRPEPGGTGYPGHREVPAQPLAPSGLVIPYLTKQWKCLEPDWKCLEPDSWLPR